MLAPVCRSHPRRRSSRSRRVFRAQYPLPRLTRDDTNREKEEPESRRQRRAPRCGDRARDPRYQLSINERAYGSPNPTGLERHWPFGEAPFRRGCDRSREKRRNGLSREAGVRGRCCRCWLGNLGTDGCLRCRSRRGLLLPAAAARYSSSSPAPSPESRASPEKAPATDCAGHGETKGDSSKGEAEESAQPRRDSARALDLRNKCKAAPRSRSPSALRLPVVLRSRSPRRDPPASCGGLGEPRARRLPSLDADGPPPGPTSLPVPLVRGGPRPDSPISTRAAPP